MLPVVALVGRPNVGKSTLFNRLTRKQDALVADYPGLTRDRQYGEVQWASRPFLVNRPISCSNHSIPQTSIQSVRKLPKILIHCRL